MRECAVCCFRMVVFSHVDSRASQYRCEAMVNFVRPDYGLFICFDCLRNFTIEVSHKRKRDQLAWPREVLFHERSAIGGRETNTQYVLLRTFCDTSRSHESCGPIVTSETIRPIRATAESLALFEMRDTGVKKLTLDLITPHFVAQFDAFLNDSIVGLNTKADSLNAKSILTWFERFEGLAKELTEASNKRKAEAKDARRDTKRQKVEEMHQVIRNMMATKKSLPEWILDTAVSSPLYFILTAEFRKAPSKTTKRDLIHICETIHKFYCSIPDEFGDFIFLKTDPANPNAPFYTNLTAIARHIGRRKLLLHSTNPSDTVFFNLLRANLHKEAILFKCLPHIRDAFLWHANHLNPEIALLSAQHNDTLHPPIIARAVLDSAVLADADKELVAAFAALYLDGAPAPRDVLERYGAFDERERARLRMEVNARRGLHSQNVNAVLENVEGFNAAEKVRLQVVRALWRSCGGKRAVERVRRCGFTLVGLSELDEKRDIGALTDWVVALTRKNAKLTVLDEEIVSLAEGIDEKQESVMESLDHFQNAVKQLEDVFVHLQKATNAFIHNVARFDCGMVGDLLNNADEGVIDLDALPEQVIDLDPEMNLYEFAKTNRMIWTRECSDVANILIFRGQFREAAVIRGGARLSEYFAEAAMKANPDIFSKLEAQLPARQLTMDELKRLCGTLWEVCGGADAVEQMSNSITPISVNDFVNDFASGDRTQWKGKGKMSAADGCDEDPMRVVEMMERANTTFLHLLGRCGELVSRVLDHHAKSGAVCTLSELVRDALQCENQIRDLIEGKLCL
ncbi:hypothetical protein BC830DRAFT_515549 [Chytriomyces sp. MP71]|nr:hypothetical protein BC830DRAFT_515549 [Chytriomyces sp. MP71]